MSKQTIERKIASIVEQLPGWSYIYDDFRTINQRLDNADLPVVFFTIPMAGAINVGISQYTDTAQTTIAFAQACELDHDGILLDAEVIEKCKRAAVAFINLCNLSGLFEHIDTQQYEVFINSYDVNVAGITIHPEIKELSGISSCSTTDDILNG